MHCLILFSSKGQLFNVFYALELIVLAVNLNFIFFSLDLQESKGLFIAVILLAVAAVDTAIGLSLLLRYHNISYKISIKSLSKLKG